MNRKILGIVPDRNHNTTVNIHEKFFVLTIHVNPML